MCLFECCRYVQFCSECVRQWAAGGHSEEFHLFVCQRPLKLKFFFFFFFSIFVHSQTKLHFHARYGTTDKIVEYSR